MKYAIIIDSVAAVPDYFLEKRPFAVMPVSVEVDGELVPDDFDEDALIDFYQGGKLKEKSKIRSSPPTREQISDLITNTIAPEYDYALCQTISKQISPTFDNFEATSQGIAKSAREIRDGLGLEHSFRMSCINTGSTIAGSGLIAIYADMILNKGISYNDYIATINKFRKLVHCYCVVPNVLYSRARGLEKGVKTMSLPAALVGKSVGLNPIVQICYDHVTKPVTMIRGMDKSFDSLFTYAAEQIKNGLYVPIVNISYVGDKKELKSHESFRRLLSVAKEHNVKILVSVMSLAGGVIFGPQAITLGIAPKDQTAIPLK